MLYSDTCDQIHLCVFVCFVFKNEYRYGLFVEVKQDREWVCCSVFFGCVGWKFTFQGNNQIFTTSQKLQLWPILGKTSRVPCIRVTERVSTSKCSNRVLFRHLSWPIALVSITGSKFAVHYENLLLASYSSFMDNFVRPIVLRQHFTAFPLDETEQTVVSKFMPDRYFKILHPAVIKPHIFEIEFNSCVSNLWIGSIVRKTQPQWVWCHKRPLT